MREKTCIDMEHIRRLQHLALDQYNNIVDIKNTEDNKKYYCPFCHKEMITKRGSIREWHFAHKKETCSYDNYLHSIAKIMIMNWFNLKDRIMLHMNAIEKCSEHNKCMFYEKANCSNVKVVEHNLKDYYTNCILEHKYGNFISDLYCESKNDTNSPIFIEIHVTHKCSQEKINSGIRIIEISIQSEEDIYNIIQSVDLIESETVKLYNFKRRELVSGDYKIPFLKFILLPSTKCYIDKEAYSCRNYNTFRKGIYEISMSYDDCTPIFLFNGGLSMVGKAMAYNDHFLAKDYWLCSWKAQDRYGTYFCKLYKRYGNPKYCKDNDSSKCIMFKADLNEIENAINFFNEYLKKGHIDIWKK